MTPKKAARAHCKSSSKVCLQSAQASSCEQPRGQHGLQACRREHTLAAAFLTPGDGGCPSAPASSVRALSYDSKLRFCCSQVRGHMQLARAARKLGHHILMHHSAPVLYRAPAGLGTGPGVRTCRGGRHTIGTGACSGFTCSAAATSATSVLPTVCSPLKQQAEVSHLADTDLRQADAAPAAAQLNTGGPSGPDRHTAGAAHARQPGRGSTPASIPDTPRLGPQSVEPRHALNTAAEPDAAPCTEPPPATRGPEPDPRDAGAAPSTGNNALAEALAQAPNEQASGLTSEGRGTAVGSRSDATCSGESSNSAHSNVHTAAGTRQRPSVQQAPAVDTGTYISELHLWCAYCQVRWRYPDERRKWRSLTSMHAMHA